jgi:CheY-like chemotaxis protein
MGKNRMVERKILVVDDEPIILEMLSDAFGKVGYSVLRSTNAEQAIEILGQETIPVMFIDLGLETMNGFELCEHIRKENPEAIIYALTGYAGLFGSHEIFEAGFDNYFAKPIRLQDLYIAVRESFEKLDRLAYKKTIKRILVVDDEEQFRKMLRKTLEQGGYEVVEAADGDEAIKRHFDQPADLIITDIIMPRKEGIETVLEIKEKDPKVKFIVVSGDNWYSSDVEFEIAKTLGAKTLKKPFERKALFEAIKQLQNEI